MTALAFDERFGLLVEAEWLARENKRLARTSTRSRQALKTRATTINIQLFRRVRTLGGPKKA